MPRATRDDPVRADVERWLRSFVGAALAMPVIAAARARHCLGGRVGQVTDRVAEPMRLVRSIVELAVGAPRPDAADDTHGVAAPDTGTDAAERGSGTPAANESPVLPIDEYESLAASHVVARLGNLTPAELRQIREFEVAHRGRRTVIGRIDQLLGHAKPT
jgi:hypothetical protein